MVVIERRRNGKSVIGDLRSERSSESRLQLERVDIRVMMKRTKTLTMITRNEVDQRVHKEEPKGKKVPNIREVNLLAQQEARVRKVEKDRKVAREGLKVQIVEDLNLQSLPKEAKVGRKEELRVSRVEREAEIMKVKEVVLKV
jgi:hypothetical protein